MKMRSPWLKTTGIALALLLALTACGQGNEGNTAATSDNGKKEASQTEPVKQAAPVKLKLAYDYGNTIPSMSPESNDALNFLQEKLGVNFEFNVNAYDIYKEKIRVQIASGDLPDAFAWRSMDAFIVDMIKSGTIIPLDEYIDQYPNLKKQKDLYITKYQNKTWAITNIRNPVASSDAPLIRQDWLDNLGLQAPKTTDELYQVAKAFTDNDPDQNNKKDTYGIQIGFASNKLSAVSGIERAFGIPVSRYAKQGDKYIPTFAMKEYKDYLTWMQKAFKDGLIDPDFAVTDGRSVEAKVVSKGQAGIVFHYMSRINDFEDNFKKAHPEAKLVPFEPVKGPSGAQAASARVNYGGIFITKEAAKDPAKIQKLMEWLDFGASDEGGQFNAYGVEGIHHTKKDGKIEVNADLISRDMPGAFIWTLPMQKTEEVFVSSKSSEETKKLVIDGNKMLEKYLEVPDPIHFAFSPTASKYQAEADAFINTNTVKVIMGSVSVSDWDGIVKQWYDRFEGNKWMEEIASNAQ